MSQNSGRWLYSPCRCGEEGAEADDPLAAEPLCEDATEELRAHVPIGEPAEDVALLHGVPVELAVRRRLRIDLFNRVS